MEDNIVKEKISEAFMQLLMAKNRFMVYSSKSDDGVDLIVNPLISYTRPGGIISYIDSPNKMDIQLKCTTEKYFKENKNGDFNYALRVKDYENLIVRRDCGYHSKMILVVFVLPENESEWLSLLEDHIRLAKHAYWFYPDSSYTLSKTAHLDKQRSTNIICLKNNKIGLDFKTIFEGVNEI